jgi:oxalate decarboxylase
MSNPVEPIRGTRGASDPGPRNAELDLQNLDVLLPPDTDAGSIPNLKFSFGMAHNRLEDGHVKSLFANCLSRSPWPAST